MDTNMPVSLQYDGSGKLMISGLACACPCEHSVPAQDIYVGRGLLPRLPEMIKKRGLGRRCVLVADTITYAVAGRDAHKVLTEEGFEVISCVIVREGEMLPDERACGEVLLSIQPETDFLLSVGSGSVTDITRVNARRTGLPFVCVGTAPSMDGYTSVISPLLFNGVKIHRAGVCPDIILCDLDILMTAPLHMVQAGVGDVLGKYIAVADWEIGSLINGEAYCPVCGEIVLGAVGKLLDNIHEIRGKTEKGIRILIEALLLSGITIMIIGHTRAVASVEHNIAHYWEMMELLSGEKAPSHGTSVGAATLMVWPLYTRFAGEDLGALNPDAIRVGRLNREGRVRWMKKAFGEVAGEAIMRDNPGDFLSWEEQLRRVRAAQANQQAIRDVIHALPPYDAILGAMRALGAPLTAAGVGVSDSLRNLSMHCAMDYRSRYTLFKLIDECGLAEEYLKEYPLP